MVTKVRLNLSLVEVMTIEGVQANAVMIIKIAKKTVIHQIMMKEIGQTTVTLEKKKNGFHLRNTEQKVKANSKQTIKKGTSKLAVKVKEATWHK